MAFGKPERHFFMTVGGCFLAIGLMAFGLTKINQETEEDRLAELNKSVVNFEYFKERTSKAEEFCKPRGGFVDMSISRSDNNIITMCANGEHIKQMYKKEI